MHATRLLPTILATIPKNGDKTLEATHSALLSENEYAHILDTWLSGIPSEIAFWDSYMRTKGSSGSHRWEDVISDARPFRLDADLDLPVTKFLDAGSGPFSRCGFKTDKTDLSLVPVDALAPAYCRLKQMHGITSGINPQFGFAEILSDLFPANHFDIVHMSNSLDHSIDPILSLYNLLYVCKVGGKVILRHTKNEAKTENYTGLHQWNLCVEDSHFFIWRGDLRIDVKKLFGSCIEMETFEDIVEQPECRWKYDKVVLRKQGAVSIPQSSFRKVCFEKLASAVFWQAFAQQDALGLAQRCARYEQEILQHKRQLVHMAKRIESLAQFNRSEN